MSAQPAARVGDKVAHTMALDGALMGLALGALIGVAIVATGGLGAIAIGAAIATTGGLGLAGEYIGESKMGPPSGAIIEGSPTIFINGKPAARATLSTALCREGPPQKEATGAKTVYFDGMPAGRKDEKLTCSAKIIEGSSDVFIGGPSEQTLPMDPEVPQWLHNTMTAMMWGGTILATGGIAATYGAGAALGSLAGGFGGGMLGSTGGRWAAEKLGFGETGQRIGEVLGGLGGGAIGGGLGFKGGQAAMNRAIANPRTADQALLRGGTQFRDTFVARQRTAADFYKSQGFAENRIPGHLDGIDFTKPVEVVRLDQGTPLTQYQAPGGSQGNYYAPKGTPASELGISPNGVNPATGEIIPKTSGNYVVGNDGVTVLRSTAAPVKDTWSVPGQSIQTDGGGTQYFTTSKDAFGPGQ